MMRRWRTLDDRTLVESPSFGPEQYYRIGRDGEVDRVYKKESSPLAGEMHHVSFVVIGNQLICRHTVDRPHQPVEDRSSVELDKLAPLTPDEAPTEKQAREAIAVHTAGAAAVEGARQEQIDRLVQGAPAGLRDLVDRLAGRAVRDDDPLSKSMMACLAAVAGLARGGSVPQASMRAATDAVALAGRLMTGDPAVASAVLPALSGEAVAVIDRLSGLAADLERAARRHDNYAGDAGAATAAGYRNAAAVLRVAAFHLGTGVEVR